MSINAPSPSEPVSAPVFTAHEGKVFRRQTYLAEPSRLLSFLEAASEVGDWFSPFAADQAAELRDAISVAEDFQHIHERSAA